MLFVPPKSVLRGMTFINFGIWDFLKLFYQLLHRLDARFLRISVF